MVGVQDRLWPFGTRAALLAAVLIWFAAAMLAVASRTYLGWPNDDSAGLAALIVIGLGLIPLAFMLLDFAASRGAVLDIKGVKIDFSGVDLSESEVKRETPGIPDNIGESGPIPTDTIPMNIIETLRSATRSEIVVVDLKDGQAWWVTRLLALAAGAKRAGSPSAFVFVGKRANRDHQFLGWAKPVDVVNSILRDNDKYRKRYDRAIRIARQVVVYGQNEFVPTADAEPLKLHNDVQRYINIPAFVDLGERVTEQILMDQLAVSIPDEPSLESPPDKLTVARLDHLFGHCLYQESIDLTWPKEQQIAGLLGPVGGYLTLVEEGRYESMIKREDGERLILRELFRQTQNKK